MLLGHGQKSTLQAPVFAVVALKVSICPVVYAASVGVNATTYVSSPPTSSQYINVLDCVFLAISLGNTDNKAPVPPVSVPAILSAVVAISTLPATVVLAFGCVDHAAKAFHAQAIY